MAALLTILITPIWIKFSRARRIGQTVRTDGPQAHLNKQGTPTLGGLVFLLAAAAAYFLMAFARGYTLYGEIALLVTVLCGLIGLVDDYFKAVKVRSLGLKARYKIVLEVGIAFLLGYLVLNQLNLPTTVHLPLTQVKVDLAIFYYLLVGLVIVGTTNSVNLTDGLDGLAAGTAAIVSFTLAAIAFRQDLFDLAVFGAAVAGACIGFLWYNAYPADIFMGDTGSLALGGAIAAMAILTKTELFLIIIGGIYVIEAFSVIIQVLFFRYFKRRVFKMAPIHHHFEILGWSETKVMVRFLVFTAALAGWGFSLYFITAVR
jgi:phospho-N-acetylmuramoyl-pentapeptide-transferase